MPDKVEIIKGLDEARYTLEQHVPPRYYTYALQAIKDAIALLKEQEAEKPVNHSDMWFCGSCKYAIPRTVIYCPKCGRKVNWDA